MSWLSDLAGRAETLLNNLDEQTGAVLRSNGNVIRTRPQTPNFVEPGPKKRPGSKPKRNPVECRSNYAPVRKSSPVNQSRSTVKGSLDNVRTQERRKRSPGRKPPQYNLHHCPRTLVDDIDNCGVRRRRFSLPSDLEIINHENMTYDMQNLEVENAMLKNELNVVNREVSDLLDRLRKTEDELTKAQTKIEAIDKINKRLILDKEGLTVQLDDLRSKIEEVSVVELSQYKTEKQALASEIKQQESKITELETEIRNLSDQLHNKNSIQTKLENDLRHAHIQIAELEEDVEKKKSECFQLEKEWESYKMRVKSMLFSKDNEIKALREDTNISEGTKRLIEEIDCLKEERDNLSHGLTEVRAEYSDMKHQMSQLEARHSNAERIVTALRDALKDERSARSKAEAQVNSLNKELQNLQVQTGQTIANLRATIHEKEEELLNLKEASLVPTSDTSALNVGDYDVMQSIESEKIQYLTQTLIQKQNKIDSLLADNNILKIQLDKLESKYKSDIASLRAQTHVVQLHEERRRTSPLGKMSVRMGQVIKRFPLLRICIMFYMIGLHFWVLTVLLTSTPDNYIRQPKL